MNLGLQIPSCALCEDFSNILVVLGFEIQGEGEGEEVGTPIRLMAKSIGLRQLRAKPSQLRANVTVRSSWSSPKFCPGES